MAEAASPAPRVIVKALNELQLSPLMTGNYHLADAVTVMHYERHVGEVHQYGANLATIV